MMNGKVIIKKSSEDWYIKIHPIYKRWGEDQPKIVKTLVNKIFNQNIPKNIKIIYDYPKLQLFKNANRINPLILLNGTLIKLKAATVIIIKSGINQS